MVFAPLPAFSHFLRYPQWRWALLVPLPSVWVCVCSRTLWVSPTNSPVRPEFLPLLPQPPQVFSISGLRLYFPVLAPWIVCVTGSASCSLACPAPHLPPHWVLQPPLCRESSPPSCASPPLLLGWVSVSSLTPWLSDFHTVRFSVSSGCFMFLNCCCPAFGCLRRHSVSTYTSILARSLAIFINVVSLLS